MLTNAPHLADLTEPRSLMRHCNGKRLKSEFCSDPDLFVSKRLTVKSIGQGQRDESGLRTKDKRQPQKAPSSNMPLFFRLSYMSSIHTSRRFGLMTECCYCHYATKPHWPCTCYLLWKGLTGKMPQVIPTLQKSCVLHVKIQMQQRSQSWFVFNIAKWTWACGLEEWPALQKSCVKTGRNSLWERHGLSPCRA